MINPLQQAVLDNVPAQFFFRLLQRHEAIYAEARQYAFGTALWDAPEAESVFPIARRAIFEGESRRIAKSLSIPHEDCLHHGFNYGYLLLKPGRMLLTMHHVDRPKRFVRPCSSRKQNAGVNRLLLNPYFEELLLAPIPEIATGLNAHVLHGLIRETINGEVMTKPFMTLAFPHPEENTYVDAMDIREVIQLFSSNDALSDDTVVMPADFGITLKPDAAKVDEREKRAKAKADTVPKAN
jgi:hypothetical protein